MTSSMTDDRRRPRIWAGVLLGGAIAGTTLTSAALAQDASDAAAATPTANADEDLRFPLIREGSRLVQVRGRVDRDARTKALRLTIDEADPQSPGHRLVLMPSSRLTELEMVVGSDPDVSVPMVVTGRVFVYDGRNYLLLTHPAVPDERSVLGGSSESAGTAGDAEAGADRGTGTDTGDDDESSRTDDDSVDDIARDLERSVGSVGRRTRRGTDDAASEDTELPGAALATQLRPEGTRLVDRRGKIRRTGRGAFVIVFDADATGESDPPMVLLPCRLLEPLGRIASRRGDGAAVLISGEVTIHAERNYLLPSVYRIPREQTRLRP